MSSSSPAHRAASARWSPARWLGRFTPCMPACARRPAATRRRSPRRRSMPPSTMSISAPSIWTSPLRPLPTHNAGHMVFGPAEAFTPEQFAELYDVNVLSTQRVNRAALPQLRRQGKGLLIWVSSSSSAGGTPPYLAPYFAAKAAMDALAVVYARELTRWGIETSIIVPGAFTGGTNHFARAGSPADKARAAEYDAGPYAGFADQVLKGFV